jgi:molybdopterin molybdotransferase
MGTEFLKIKEVDEAKKIIEELFEELYEKKSTMISIEESYGRTLFKDITSLIDLPPFKRSLMDGFAVKAEDTFGASDESPKILKCIDSIEAGSFSERTVNKGECIEISTGAPIPKGADSIAMVEFTERETNKEDKDENVYILKSVAPNQDLALKGSDIKKDKLLLYEKTLLTPDKIGVLAAQGIQEIEVFKKPEIVVISTGNELITEKETLEYGKIYDVNSYTIKNAAIAHGANVTAAGIVKDNYDELKEKIENSLESSDIVICSGGTSAGVGDVLRHVLDDIGEVIIHGVSVKPGKPTIIGKVNEKLVIGLPGNPVSALIIFYVFIIPNIRNLAGRSKESIEKAKVTLAKRIHSPKGRMHYSLVKIKEEFAYPIVKDSGAITSLADADGYIKIPKTTELLEEGKQIEVILFK